MKRQQVYLLAAILALAAPLALAQTATPAPAPAHSATAQKQAMRKAMRERMQKRRMMRGAMGSHRMEGSVMSVDKTTGMLEVKSNGHTVRVHFPPETLAGLKTGDKVMLRMSFRKVTPEMEARMKQREDRMKARRDKMKSKAAAAAKKDGK